MVEFRVVRRVADAKDTETGVVLARGEAASVSAIEPPMDVVNADPCAKDPGYDFVLQVYVVVGSGKHCRVHGWWDIRTLRTSASQSWNDTTDYPTNTRQCLTSSDVPVSGHDDPTHHFRSFTATDIRLSGTDLRYADVV